MEKSTVRTMKSDVQASFLNSIRNRIPGHLSLSDELAELLNISRDSAYRRIREETILSLDEVQILCNRYNLSIDSIITSGGGNISFEYGAQFGPGLSLKCWLESILVHLKNLECKAGAKMTWHAKDLPTFHYFQFPRLAAFKFFWWTNLSAGNGPTLDRYEEGMFGPELMSLAAKIWKIYSAISSTEIISRELINPTLRQIEYSYDSGFLSKDQAIALCNDAREMIRNLEQQAQQGSKILDAEPAQGSFEVYVNELQIGDNTILLKAENKQTSFVTHNNFNILSTDHVAFCHQTEQFMNTTIQRSVLISRVAQKERIKFFNRIHRDIDEVVNSLGR